MGVSLATMRLRHRLHPIALPGNCPNHLGDLIEFVPLRLHLHHEQCPLDRLVQPARRNVVAAVGGQRGLGQEPESRA